MPNGHMCPAMQRPAVKHLLLFRKLLNLTRSGWWGVTIQLSTALYRNSLMRAHSDRNMEAAPLKINRTFFVSHTMPQRYKVNERGSGENECPPAGGPADGAAIYETVISQALATYWAKRHPRPEHFEPTPYNFKPKQQIKHNNI